MFVSVYIPTFIGTSKHLIIFSPIFHSKTLKPYKILNFKHLFIFSWLVFLISTVFPPYLVLEHHSTFIFLYILHCSVCKGYVLIIRFMIKEDFNFDENEKSEYSSYKRKSEGLRFYIIITFKESTWLS